MEEIEYTPSGVAVAENRPQFWHFSKMVAFVLRHEAKPTVYHSDSYIKLYMSYLTYLQGEKCVF